MNDKHWAERDFKRWRQNTSTADHRGLQKYREETVWQLETTKRRAVHKAVFNGKKQEVIVDRLATILKSSNVSVFQYEAPARHGLRQAMLAKGFAWQRSDDEAHRLISAAFHRIGAVRPTWQQGQREYTIARENCSWCRGELDDEQIARNERFCCGEHAKAAVQLRDYETRAMDDEIGRRAVYLIQRGNNPERKCGYCERRFKPLETEGEYCSRICRRRSRGDLLEDRACLNCSAVFHPRADEFKFCSTTCYGEAKRKLIDRQCENPACGKVFRPKGINSKYCCHACSIEGRELILPIRPCAYALCGINFQPKNDQAKFCSPKCNQRTKDARQKAKRHAKKGPGDSPIDRLFDKAA
ncbi:hypothetical protein NKH74_10645 [Mesorhizobium sp. M0933]|uniref:hypothetical protein n=1 Tax=Mesorhizobium sp. M0933 TaxID=2957030 RepID=UPI0033356CF0